MNDGLVDERIKREVLNGLKDAVSENGDNGDLKERVDEQFKIHLYNIFKIYFTLMFSLSKKPDNLLVDFDYVNGRVDNFTMVISDWGTAGQFKKHMGGTPMYASRMAFQADNNKDLFAFGRIAMELYLDESGA